MAAGAETAELGEYPAAPEGPATPASPTAPAGPAPRTRVRRERVAASQGTGCMRGFSPWAVAGGLGFPPLQPGWGQGGPRAGAEAPDQARLSLGLAGPGPLCLPGGVRPAARAALGV